MAWWSVSLCGVKLDPSASGELGRFFFRCWPCKTKWSRCRTAAFAALCETTSSNTSPTWRRRNASIISWSKLRRSWQLKTEQSFQKNIFWFILIFIPLKLVMIPAWLSLNFYAVHFPTFIYYLLLSFKWRFPKKWGYLKQIIQHETMT